MHPEIQKDTPSRCPKCGMKLVRDNNIPAMDHASHDQAVHTTWKSYIPLIVIIGLILVTSLIISWREVLMGSFSLSKSISYFMTGFFITFAGFKMMDLGGFAQGYYTYDLIAKRWFGYGYVYPFIELFFGLSMILFPAAQWILWVEGIVMILSGLGVSIKLAKHEKFQCACLGTFLKVPLTKVTLIEDFGMALLAFTLLLLK
jgi:hypothetical protein